MLPASSLSGRIQAIALTCLPAIPMAVHIDQVSLTRHRPQDCPEDSPEDGGLCRL
ncbi:MAG: hypothetical protein HC886_07750 [Leptolyngbyaceae cyanobacterium SM1_1_3]|nr:hypothetical protein [Leptolyngbyaceae cyanobacterium SM1_1_3]NJO10160.1 hypothetical protein [Leptolyngbyaceae cyanobacterium SL_1_1]